MSGLYGDAGLVRLAAALPGPVGLMGPTATDASVLVVAWTEEDPTYPGEPAAYRLVWRYADEGAGDVRDVPADPNCYAVTHGGATYQAAVRRLHAWLTEQAVTRG